MHDTLAHKIPRKNRNLGYHFLPARFHRTNILQWLKRVHAWTGFWGAILFFFIGLSGFFLNHRSVLKIDTGASVEIADLAVTVAPDLLTSPEEFTAWVKQEFSIEAEAQAPRRRPGAQASFAGQDRTQLAEWQVRFSGPDQVIEARYTPGANIVHLEAHANNVLGILKNLHKGSGLGAAWVLFLDTLAGALIFMSLTGILLWSKLHGSRLLGLGILGTSIAAAIATALPSFLLTSFG